MVTGDEILRGRIQERNAGLLARSLEASGVRVERVEVVGDDLGALVAAIRAALDGGVDLLCTSGGLGPTHDDLTMEAVAAATGRDLVLDPAALAMVEKRLRGYRRTPGVWRQVAEKQAMLPAGATLLPPAGTAPGAALEHDGAIVVVLPGPPWELREMWEAVRAEPPLAALLARGGGASERVLRAFAVPESRVLAALRPFDQDAWERLAVGICAKDAELEITVRSAAEDAWAADALEARLGEELGAALYSRDGATVDEVVARRLIAAGQTVAVAESCTGGGLGARLTALPGSSAYMLGGVISYSDDVKRGVLGVDPGLLRRHGAVSAPVAEGMAAGVRELIGSDWALSITGVAGPGGGTPEKPVGLVYVGLAEADGVATAEHRLRGDREAIRDRSAALALHALRIALEAREGV
ncbi:MAG TPA: competence/damage-inducible protein A [Miltoncostaeaceae bacterium]|nr:competence/damage-inducible protein A [Miltoncostaeaceae bacterium]